MKRKCIFTGQEANWSTYIGDDKHNWSKRVPCAKEWWEANQDRPLTPGEFKLVELFFEQELARLKIDNLEAEMERIRKKRRPLKDIAEDIDRINNEIPTILRVSEETYNAIQNVIENPPEPNQALIDAFKENEDGIKYIDEPEGLDRIAAEEIMNMPPLELPEEAKVLPEPKKHDKIKKKKVVKKKPELWD